MTNQQPHESTTWARSGTPILDSQFARLQPTGELEPAFGQISVNQGVVGSSPTSGARHEKAAAYRGFFIPLGRNHQQSAVVPDPVSVF